MPPETDKRFDVINKKLNFVRWVVVALILVIVVGLVVTNKKIDDLRKENNSLRARVLTHENQIEQLKIDNRVATAQLARVFPEK